MDVYQKNGEASAPVIVMLHGGAFRFRDKRKSDVWQAKVSQWLLKGYVFISVNIRLIPNVNPIKQMDDLAQVMGLGQQMLRIGMVTQTRLFFWGILQVHMHQHF